MQSNRSRESVLPTEAKSLLSSLRQVGPVGGRWRRWRCLLLGLLLIGWTQACQCDKPQCKDSSECPASLSKCVGGYCLAPCQTDDDCESGERCLASVCVDPSQEPSQTEQTPDGGDAGSTEPSSPDTPKPEQGGGDSKDAGPTPEGGTDTATPEGTTDTPGEVTPDATPDATTDGPAPDATPDGPAPDGSTPETSPDATPDGPAGVCRSGETRDCYNALASTKGVGPCKAGTQTCTSDGRWGACTGAVVPQLETCDGVDNDCDGTVDEDYPQKGVACQVSAGECAGTGNYACTSDGRSLFCEVKGKQSAPEKCDGKDNDCDGLVDEDFPKLGTACFDGNGACKRQGAIVCTQDQTGTECNAKAGPSYTERCNGRDDDCDGSVDEDFTTKGNACKVGVGACENSGKLVCNKTGSGVICDAVAGQPATEVCDGKDNDCNGSVDDNLTNLPLCSLQNGVCKGARQACVGGVLTPCDATLYSSHDAAYEATETKCDGKDNDCDGSTDEGFTTLGNSCTVTNCNVYAGKIVCDPNDGTKTVCDIKLRQEQCNGEDDNCDGRVDENCPACMPQTSQYCYPGPPGTDGIGICSGSSQSCDSNGKWDSCPEWSGPAATDTCADARDNDCNGIADEGCGDCPFVKEVGSLKGHAAAVNSAMSRFSTAVTASSDNTAKIWRLSTYRVSYTLSGHTAPVLSADIHDLVVTGSEDKTLRVWSRSGTFQRSLTGHTSAVTYVKFNRDGDVVASASKDMTIKLWDPTAKLPATGLKATLTGHTAGVNAVDFDVHNRYLVSAGADNTVRLWDLTTNKQIGKSLVCAGAIDVVFYPDGSMIAAACTTTYLVWEVSKIVGAPTVAATPLRTFTPPAVPRLGADKARSLDITADGSSLIGGTALGYVVQFNFTTGAVIESHQAHSGGVFHVHRLDDNTGFLTSGGDNTARRWGCAAHVPSPPACTPNNGVRTIASAHADAIRVVEFSRFAKTLFTAGDDKLIRQFNTSTGAAIRTFTGHTQAVSDIAINLKGDRLASCSADGTVRIWEIATGKLLHTVTYTGPAGAILLNRVAFAPDSVTVAVAAADNNVYLIDSTTGTKTTTLTGHTGAVNAVIFGGTSLVSASSDGTLRTYYYSTFSNSYVFSRAITVETQGAVYDVVYANNFRYYTLSGALKSTIKVYRTFGTLDKTFPPARTQTPFNRIAVSPDGSYVAGANSDGNIYFWNYTSNSVAGSLSGHSSSATDFDWTYDGQMGASVSADRSIRILDCQAPPVQ